MKLSYHLFALLLLFGICKYMVSAQDVPNHDFENWVIEEDPSGFYPAWSIEEPAEWLSSNWLTHPLSEDLLGLSMDSLTVFRTDDSYSADSAIQLICKEDSLQATAVLGQVSGANIRIGIPFDKKPIALGGYYKYYPVASDTTPSAIGIELRRQRVTVASGGIRLTDTTDSYTRFDIPIEYDSNAVCHSIDSMRIGLSTNTHVGTALLVDSLFLVYDSRTNTPPVAQDTQFTTHWDSTITVCITGNDYDPDEDGIQIGGITTFPASGTLLLMDDHCVEYAPDSGFTGEVTFNYFIADDAHPSDCSESATVTITVEESPYASVPEPDVSSQVKGYPNPARDYFTVELAPSLLASSANPVIQVYDVLGNEILQKAITSAQTTVSTADLPTGLYIYQVRQTDTGAEYLHTGKIQVIR